MESTNNTPAAIKKVQLLVLGIGGMIVITLTKALPPGGAAITLRL